MPELQVYGLLHLQSGERSAMNAGTRDFADQTRLYGANALTLARSLALQGIRFTLLTNRSDLLADLGQHVELVEIPFRTQLPSGTPFYSAHYKIDVFAYFASLDDDVYRLFCDLDVVCINRLPQAFANLIARRIPVCYDVTDQVLPAHGPEDILRDLSVVGGIQSEGRWYGGEFLGGSSTFFRALHDEIQKMMPHYIANLPTSHHVSDEAVVSPALERLRSESDFYVADGGPIGLISRYWNTHVLHPQRDFSWSQSCFLLHLPADKRLLAEVSTWPDAQVEDFAAVYSSRLERAGSWRGKVDRLVSRFLRLWQVLGC